MNGYRRHSGKAGHYGEHATAEWTDAAGRPLASTYDNNDGTETVTLYTADGTAHPRTIPSGRRGWDICEAHVKERGFDRVLADTADVRAYND